MARQKSVEKDNDRRRSGVISALAAGAKEMPRNASWLAAKALSPLSAATPSPVNPGIRDSAADAVRSTTAILTDAWPGTDSVETRIKRAHAAADAARASEQRAVAATEHADALARESEDMEAEAARRVEAAREESQAEADRRVEEFRAEQQQRVEKRVQEVAEQAEGEAQRKRVEANRARESAEAEFASATEQLAHARELSDEATKAAQQAAAEAQREAERLVGEARDTRREAKKPVAAARRSATDVAATANRVVSSAPAAARGAKRGEKLESLPKKELQDLAAAKGVDGRSAMTKAELVKALR
jgi:hypothetical protein